MNCNKIFPYFCLPFISINLYADEVSQVEEIIVTDTREYILNQANIKINDEQISNDLILDINDLVKNESGINVVQKANSGSSGFNIRGVDQDRVAILVDGIHQGETFENDIYVGYGYFDGSINEIELDSIKSVAINKGTDSLFSGSGSLGGAVLYTTKNASDLIFTKKNYGLYNKTIYGSSRSEVKTTFGIAAKQDYGDLLVLYTYINGHEQKTRNKGKDIYGKARSQADPLDKNSHNLLIKSNFSPNDSNKITLTYENYKLDKDVDERSWELFGSNHRISKAIGQRQRYSVDWDYHYQGIYLDYIESKIYHQKISQEKNSYVYNLNSNKLENNYNRKLDQISYGFDQKINLQEQQWLNRPVMSRIMYGYNNKKFINDNIDIYYLDKTYKELNSIIDPVTTEHYYLSFTNEIELSENQLIAFGGRYDTYQHKVKRNGKSISEHLYSETFVAPKDTIFNGVTYSALYDNQINNQLNIKYKISTGFRAPNANELYFSYGDDYAANRVEPNSNLREETGLTNEIYFEYITDSWYVSLSPFYTKYKNFIDLKSEHKFVVNKYYDPIRYPKEFDDQNYLQYKNVDSAYVYGLDAKLKLDISSHFNFEYPLFYQSMISYNKGKDSHGDSLMTIQPWKFINTIKLNLNNYNFGLYTTYLSKKNPKDTIKNGKQWEYINDSAFIIDFIINYDFNKNIKFNTGIFNVSNEKYKTWDSVRSIPRFGSTNMVDHDGIGLNRFTAPGMNWKVGVEIKI